MTPDHVAIGNNSSCKGTFPLHRPTRSFLNSIERDLGISSSYSPTNLNAEEILLVLGLEEEGPALGVPVT